jgi:hypothetical protein
VGRRRRRGRADEKGEKKRDRFCACYRAIGKWGKPCLISASRPGRHPFSFPFDQSSWTAADLGALVVMFIPARSAAHDPAPAGEPAEPRGSGSGLRLRLAYRRPPRLSLLITVPGIRTALSTPSVRRKPQPPPPSRPGSTLKPAIFCFPSSFLFPLCRPGAVYPSNLPRSVQRGADPPDARR